MEKGEAIVSAAGPIMNLILALIFALIYCAIYKFASATFLVSTVGGIIMLLINLIQNSIKFTDEGGFINIIVSQDEEYTTMKVVDNGAGIEKENLEKVLDKFFQEDYNKAGSGLGLAISNEIVKLHGGKMILNSKKGVGTSITVKIKNTLIKSI